MDLAARRIALHETASERLRAGAFADAARDVRRLLMMVPPDHDARPDLLRVLAWIERQRA